MSKRGREKTEETREEGETAPKRVAEKADVDANGEGEIGEENQQPEEAEGHNEEEEAVVIYHDPQVEQGMRGYLKNDLILQIILDQTEEGNKLRYEHMYGLWKLVCAVYGYENLPTSLKTAFSYAILNCNKRPIVMFSFLFVALHLEHSLAEYLAPPEPGPNHPPELRHQYKHVMGLMTEDLKKYEDGCIRPAATEARLRLPDAIRPKVPPTKLVRFKQDFLKPMFTTYASGEGGCKLRTFTEECIWNWTVMGVSWRAH